MDNSEGKVFKFSKTFTVLSIVFCLTASPLDLLNETFLVPYNELAAEDVILGLPLLKHLGIYLKDNVGKIYRQS